MASLRGNILLRAIEGSLRGANKARENKQAAQLKETELEMDKKKTDAYISKVQADIDYQKAMGLKSIADLDMNQQMLDLQKKELNAQQQMNSLAIANARFKAGQEEKARRLEAAEGKRKYMDMILKSEKPGWGDYSIDEAKKMAEEMYGGVGVMPQQQETQQATIDQALSALNEKFK